jgi:hypothetical protein
MKWLRRTLALAFLFPAVALAGEGEDQGFMSRLSTWNPVRDHFSRPLMEKIPDFEIRGYVQNTTMVGRYGDMNRDMNLPPFADPREVFRVPVPGFPDYVGALSFEPYEKTGWPPMRNTDTTLQKIEWFMELEPRYRPTPHLQFVLKVNFLYNSAYDWNSDFSAGFGESERDLEYYRRADQILREWYLDYIRGPLQVRIGRQQVQWGKVDGRQILDMVHGVDYTRWPLGASSNPFFPAEYWRVPKFMTNIQVFADDFLPGGDWQFQLLWMPDFEPSRANYWPSIQAAPFQFNPRPTSPLLTVRGGAPFMPQLNPEVTLESADEPSWSFDKSEIGFMAKLFTGGWDFSLHYLYAWNDRATLFTDIDLQPFQVNPPPAAPTPVPVRIAFQPRFTRVHKVGLGADRTWSMLGRQWAAKFEGRYVKDAFYPTSDWTPENKGQRKADSLLTGLQIETYVLRDTSLVLRWDHEQVFDYGGDLTNFSGSRLARHQDGIFFTIIDPVAETYDRLVLRSSLAYFTDGQWRWEPVVTYELTEDLNLMLGGQLFWGDPDQIFGQFSRYKGVSFGFRGSF